MSPLIGVGAQCISSPLLMSGSRERHELTYQSLNLSLSVADNQGRQFELSFSKEYLAYSGTYDRFGMIASPNGSSAADALVERVRAFAGDSIAEQFRNMAGERGLLPKNETYAWQSRRIEMMSVNTSFSIEGDSDLIRDYFSASSTARRIFDFARALGSHLEPGSDEFSAFLTQIRSGIEAGFEMAEAVLGPLPEVSKETHALLRLMLDSLENGEMAED